MIQITELRLPIDHTPQDLEASILSRLNISAMDLIRFQIFKRSHDARKNSSLSLIYNIHLSVKNEEEVLKQHAGDMHITIAPDTSYHYVTQAPKHIKSRPIVIGFGPCGIFAALILAQMGFKPIVLERGKAVRQRTQDTWGLWRKQVLQPESNVQFGEGGAGLFSDGKLYSQIKDPQFYGRKVIAEFIKAGAPPEIEFVAKPHIGTFRLVGVVERMRQEIIQLGGEVHFSSRVTQFLIENQKIRGVQLADGQEFLSNHVVLALGHSSRDTFYTLHDAGVFMEPKPFSVGFRIEHPQSIIDKAR
jgi:uncharacterized FAD-dependent dehydrogenase